MSLNAVYCHLSRWIDLTKGNRYLPKIKAFYFCPQAKQRSRYALNTTGDVVEDQDGDSR